ncbi:hypothetical protein GMMP15_1110001 [Candidatus Magnetomoraceae bacterium gMMP-15]
MSKPLPIEGITKIGGTESLTAPVNFSMDKKHVEQIETINPATGLIWTVADINNALFGFKTQDTGIEV